MVSFWVVSSSLLFIFSSCLPCPGSLPWAKVKGRIIFYDALDKVAKQTGEDGYEVWKKALANITPGVEVRSRRIGGATFQIPSEVRADRKTSLSIKWMIKYSRERNGRSMADKLANEIVAASKGEGAAFKKKEDTHRMAEANKAFAHFRI